MVSPEVAVLQGQVAELQDEMTGMQMSLSGLLTLGPRMEAIEAVQRAQDIRISHIDRVVMSIQSDIQKLQKVFAVLESQRAQDGLTLSSILETQHRMLELLQPKVTVG